jgi:hypothetical protein
VVVVEEPPKGACVVLESDGGGRVFITLRACGPELLRLVRASLKSFGEDASERPGEPDSWTPILAAHVTVSLAKHVAGVSTTRFSHECAEIHVSLADYEVRLVTVEVAEDGTSLEHVTHTWRYDDFVQGRFQVELA